MERKIAINIPDEVTFNKAKEYLKTNFGITEGQFNAELPDWDFLLSGLNRCRPPDDLYIGVSIYPTGSYLGYCHKQWYEDLGYEIITLPPRDYGQEMFDILFGQSQEPNSL